jgi:hypothetical protein
MAINNDIIKHKISGDGTERNFDFEFKIYKDTDIGVVLIDKTTGDITERSLTTHYLVDTRLVDEGGTVIFDEDHIPSADVWVFLWSKLEYTQTVVLPTDGAFREKKVTNGMDRIVRLVQQLRDKMNRAVLQDFYADTLDLTLPSPESLKVLRWNEDADNLENRDPISEVEIQKTATHIQWKLTQDTDWINLVALTEITGPQGDPGDSTHLAQDMQELTDGANISWDMDSGGFAYVTLEGNRTLDNPTNVSAGGLYRLKVVQDGTGDRTLSFGSNFKFPGNQEPVLSSGDGDVDLLEFIAYSSTELYLTNAIFDIQ